MPQPDLEATLNCGVGMVALTDPDDVDTAITLLAGHGVRAWVAGEVHAAEAERGGRVPGDVRVVTDFGAGVREHPGSR